MIKAIKLIGLYSLTFLLVACGGGGGGGGAAAVPANAITLNATNAEPTLESAAASTSALLTLAADTTEVSAGTAVALVKDIINKIRTSRNPANTEIATGIAFSDSDSCWYSGSWSASGNYTDTSESGSATLNNCEEYSGLIMSGSLSYSDTWNNSTGAYTSSGSGSLSVNVTGYGSFSLSNINYNKTGNDFSGSYSINTLSYTWNTSAGGGFALEVSPAIVGYEYSCPTSGAFTITGANSTMARATYSSGLVTVEVNTGSGFTEIAGSPVSCAGWY